MALQEQFDFYMTLAKPLALSLTNTDCRARACAWLKYLLDCEESQLKVDYVKLLLFVMQKNNLLGPFSEVPPTNGTLLPFPDNISLSKMMLRVTEKASGEFGAGDSKPQVSEFVSADLKQFVALQSLPGDRGIQCYMALGSDEMNKWEQTVSSSCSCNTEQYQAPTDHLQPAEFGGAFPPRYSPMIRYQRERRRLDQMPSLPPQDPGYQPLSLEPTWLPTKEEVYWLKRMNKMIKRAGGPDTNFMTDVKRYYEHADRSQTTDEDWDPYQPPGGPSEYSPDMMPPPDVEPQFAANADEFVDDLSQASSLENLRFYPPPPISSQSRQLAGRWIKPGQQASNMRYETEAAPYMAGRPPPCQRGLPPPAYDNSQFSNGMPPCTPGTTKPRWAKKTMDLDFNDQSYPFQTESPHSHVHYDTDKATFNDPDYSRSHPSSTYNWSYGAPPQGQRPFPASSRGPPQPRRPVSPESDLEADPSRIVVFHCQCACKK